MDIYLYLDGQQCGPFSEFDLRAMMASRTISPTDLAWRDGQPGWVPLNTLIHIAPIVPPPPPRTRAALPLPPKQKLKRGLTPCKACGNSVSKNAKACPSCGAPIKRRTSCGGCLGLIFILIIAGAVVSSISQQGGKQAANSSSPISTPQVVNVPPPVPPQVPSSSTNTPDKNVPAPQPLPEQWATIDGKVYKNVTVVSHDANNVTVSSAGGTATFPIAKLDREIQKRILDDNVTASDWTINGKTLHNVKVGAVNSDAVQVTDDEGVGSIALADLPQDLQKKFNYDPSRVPTIEEANALIGLTAEQVIGKLGQPIRVKNDDSPDGPFQQLVFNDSKNAATFCMIFQNDDTTDGVFSKGGTVSSGYYRGLAFPARTPEEEAADKKKVAEDRPKLEVAAFKAALAKAGIDNSLIESFSVQGNDLTIVVTMQYNLLDYQTRLQGAQNFEKVWTIIHGENAFLHITDHNGNEVGGTGFTGVWVQKEQ